MAERRVVGVSFAGEEWGYADKEALYLESLRGVGLDPLPVRPGAEGDIPALLRRVRGWFFSGGDDVTPEYFGETLHPKVELVNGPRDRMDLLLARALLAEGMPVLGVCYGEQILAVAAGGSVVQDIPSQVPGAGDHAGGVRHGVRAGPGTRLASILGTGEVTVNSHHHQSVGRPGRLAVCARSADGVVEAVEGTGEAFVLGVQWHPERPGCDGAAAEGVLAAFAAAVEEWNPSRPRGAS